MCYSREGPCSFRGSEVALQYEKAWSLSVKPPRDLTPYTDHVTAHRGRARPPEPASDARREPRSHWQLFPGLRT
eukprot:752012-Hanusia_phi.AAC.5